MRRIGAVAAVLASMALPTVAGARVEVAMPRGVPAFDQTRGDLAGHQLVYIRDLNSKQIHVAGRHGEDRLLFRVRDTAALDVTASSRVVAALDRRPDGSARLFTGPPTGPLTLATRCAGASAEGSEHAAVRGFAVDRDNVAYVDDCAPASAELRVVVLSGSGMPSTPIPLPQGGRADYMSLAGPYVAYRLTSPGGAQSGVVADWRTGAEALRFPIGPERTCAEGNFGGRSTPAFCGLDVQADGKVAELIGNVFLDYGEGSGEYWELDDTCGGTVSWRSPAEPEPHQLTDRACVSERMRLARDRVLFGTPSTPGSGWSTSRATRASWATLCECGDSTERASTPTTRPAWAS